MRDTDAADGEAEKTKTTERGKYVQLFGLFVGIAVAFGEIEGGEDHCWGAY